MELEGLRAVVIDDKYEEVKELFSALDKKGISYNYYSDTSNFPLKKLTGVRLVFLDFDLFNDPMLEIKNIVSNIINLMKNIISKENGPYVLVIWAKDDDGAPILDYDDVLLKLKENMPKANMPLPFLILEDFDKSDIKDDARSILKTIEKKFDLKKIINILIQWEKFGHEALNETLKHFIGENEGCNNLGEFMEQVDKKIKKDFYNLSVADLGKKNVSEKDLGSIKSSLKLLNLFFKENSDKRIDSFDKYELSVAKEICSNKEDYSEKEKSKMNAFFSLDKLKEKGIKPGSFYAIKISEKDDFKDNDFLDLKIMDNKGNNHNIILNHFDLENIKEKIFDKIFNETSYRKDLGEDIKEENVELPKEQLTEIVNRFKQHQCKKCIPIICEITPSCDYSQKKWKSSKFVMGFLSPSEIPILANSRYLSNPLLIEFDGKMYNIILNANYTLHINFKYLEEINVLFRARKDFLSTIQHWFASHSSRPGKIEFN